MESPLDILSRAAGMVSSSNSPASTTASVPLAVNSPSDMRLMKRKFEDPLDPLPVQSIRREDGILKKALIHHQVLLDTHGPAIGLLADEEDQPLDMSCKKKRQRSLSPIEEHLNRRPIHPSERTNSNSSSSISSNSHHNNRPPPAPLVERGFYGNGLPHKKKWSRSNGVDDSPINPPLSSAKLFLENNNSTSDGSGTDHARRPSVIYYATQTPDLPLSSTGGTGSLGGTGKFRRRFRHPSNSSTSTDSDAAAGKPPLIRRKLVKRKRKRPASLTPTVTGLPDSSSRPIDREEGESGCKSRRVVVITSKEDDIDEHFRRSLGDRYDEAKCFLNTTTTGSSKNGKPPTPALPEKKPQQVQEDPKEIDFADQPLSVDDHFAKALGTETWSRLISSKPSSTKNQSPPPYESKGTKEVTKENGVRTCTPAGSTLNDGDGKS